MLSLRGRVFDPMYSYINYPTPSICSFQKIHTHQNPSIKGKLHLGILAAITTAYANIISMLCRDE